MPAFGCQLDGRIFTDNTAITLPTQPGVPGVPGVPVELCAGCCQPIEDRFLLRVMDNSWHERCLQCSVCYEPLRQSCFVKDCRLFCRRDYDKLYGTRCRGCMEPIPSSELVMRATGGVYHVRCFVCVVCGQQLHKGDQFVASDSQIYCRLDFEKKCASYLPLSPKSSEWFNSKSDDDSSVDDNDADHQKGPKRPRTILTTSQRRKFKTSFEVNPKPCRKVRETLAAETGLSVRVVQVWFQNQRAKMKKIARRQNEDSQGGDKVKKTGNGKANKQRKTDDGSDCSITPHDNGDTVTAGGSSTLADKQHVQQQQQLCTDSHQLRPFNNNTNTQHDSYTSSHLDTMSYAPSSSTLQTLDQIIVPTSNTNTGGLRPLHSATLDNLLTHHSVAGQILGQPPIGCLLNPIDKLYSMQTSYFSCAD